MMKRVFVVHGWDGYPEEGWFPWLKKELEEKGFKVYVPKLPENIKIGGAVFVGGWFKRLTGLEDDPEVQKTGRHWLNAPLVKNISLRI